MHFATNFSAMVPIGLLLLLGLWTTGSCGQDSCTCEVATNCVDPCPYMTSFLDCLQQFCDVCGGESQVTSTCQDTLNSLENKCGTDCGLSCSSLSGCDQGGGDGLSLKWILIIAGASVAGLVALGALIYLYRRSKNNYRTIN